MCLDAKRLKVNLRLTVFNGSTALPRFVLTDCQQKATSVVTKTDFETRKYYNIWQIAGGGGAKWDLSWKVLPASWKRERLVSCCVVPSRHHSSSEDAAASWRMSPRLGVTAAPSRPNQRWNAIRNSFRKQDNSRLISRRNKGGVASLNKWQWFTESSSDKHYLIISGFILWQAQVYFEISLRCLLGIPDVLLSVSRIQTRQSETINPRRISIVSPVKSKVPWMM